MSGSPRPVLAVIEVRERGHRLAQALPVGDWPCTLGRALDADLILTDPAVAGQHLRLSRLGAQGVQVEVLDALNGVQHGTRLEKGGHFEWQPEQALSVGNTELRLRLPEAPLPPTQVWQPLARGGWWRTVLALVLLVLTLTADQVLDGAAMPDQWKRALPPALLSAGLVLLLWSMVWALLSRLFVGRALWLAHLRVAALGVLGLWLLFKLLHALAFALSWPALAAFDPAVFMLVLAFTLWRHLRLASHRSPRFLAGTAAVVFGAALAVQLGLQWQSEQRLQGELYLGHIYPPSWRRAPAVTAERFVQEAQDLQQALERRLARQDQEDEE